MTGTAPIPQVVIVAGGLGTRLARQTGDRPKALVPVNGRPFLGYVLDWLADSGVRRVHLCLGHRAEHIRDFLDASKDALPSLTFTTTVEPEPLGTAGCLRAAGTSVEDEFVLLLGDTYTPVDLGSLVDRWREGGHEAAMCVLHNSDWLVASNVGVRDGLVSRYDKQAPPGTLQHVDYGIAFLRRASLGRLPDGDPSDLGDLFHSLIADGALAAVEVGQRFYEIGSEAGYAEFCALVAAGTLAIEVEARSR
jgi:NDP-sugar pyrophosphorylase family protein